MTYLDGIVAFHRARAASDTRDLDGLYAQVGVGAPRGFAQALASLLLDCTSRFLQLFSTVVLFRLFMLRSTQPVVE